MRGISYSPSEIKYSRGRNVKDVYPEQRTANCFKNFLIAIDTDRADSKGQQYICCALAKDEEGKSYRKMANALDRLFLVFDVDSIESQGVFSDLVLFLHRFSGMVYTTASHTQEKPRCRVILELNRGISREEGIVLGLSFEKYIEKEIGKKKIEFDKSSYRAEQPFFTPLIDSRSYFLEGNPVDVDLIKKNYSADSQDEPIMEGKKHHYWLNELRQGNNVNQNCLKFVGHLMSQGMDDETILTVMGAVSSQIAINRGDGRVRELFESGELDRIIKGAREKGYGADNQKNTVPIKSEIIVRKANEIETKPIPWLWEPRFSQGKISMITGDPGIGKSQLTLSMAATITIGSNWPDDAPCKKGMVIILSAEDGPEDTIVPRLKTYGADLNLIFIVESVKEYDDFGNTITLHFNLRRDLDALEALLVKYKEVSAIFIDPITAYLGGIDDHKNSQVRDILAPFAKLAEKYNVAVILISHNNKSMSQKALYRVLGTMGYVAISRSVYVVTRDNHVDDKRLFLPLKNNTGKDKGGLAFKVTPTQIENGIETSTIIWLDEIITQTADEVMMKSIGRGGTEPIEVASNFIKEQLRNGPVSSNDMYARAELMGISDRTLERAKADLKVKSRRNEFGGGSFWVIEKKQHSEQQQNEEKAE